MSVREKYILQIAAIARTNLETVEQAMTRGHFVDAELRKLQVDAVSTLPISLYAYGYASEAAGVKVPEREYLTSRNNKIFGGVFVDYQNGKPCVYLYGELGTGDSKISAHQFTRAMQDIDSSEDIDLHIHSVGGCYRATTGIADFISRRSGATRGIVDGLAASGASVILMRCNPIAMAKGARIMIHFASGKMEGTASELEQAARRVRAADKELAANYLQRWRGTTAELVAALDRETTFIDEEAVSTGLADYVTSDVSIATQAEIEAAANRYSVNPMFDAERRNFTKYRTIFEKWKRAAHYMATD